MECCIKLGEINKTFAKLVSLTVILNIVSELVIKFLDFNECKNKNIYIFMILIRSFILSFSFLYFYIKNKNKRHLIKQNEQNKNSSYELVYNQFSKETITLIKKGGINHLIIIGILYFLILILSIIIKFFCNESMLSFYYIYILVFLFGYKYIFNKELYKHKIIFYIILIIISLSRDIFISIYNYNKFNKYDFLNIIITIMTAFIYLYIQKIAKFCFLSTYIINSGISLISFILLTIILIILNFIKRPYKNDIFTSTYNNKDYYIFNFKVLFYYDFPTKRNKIIIILGLILYLIAFFFASNNHLLIIQNKSVEHFFAVSLLLIFLAKIPLIGLNLISILDIIYNIIFLILFLFYSEILEISLCNLNLNTEKNIKQRIIDQNATIDPYETLTQIFYFNDDN